MTRRDYTKQKMIDALGRLLELEEIEYVLKVETECIDGYVYHRDYEGIATTPEDIIKTALFYVLHWFRSPPFPSLVEIMHKLNRMATLGIGHQEVMDGIDKLKQSIPSDEKYGPISGELFYGHKILAVREDENAVLVEFSGIFMIVSLVHCVLNLPGMKNGTE